MFRALNKELVLHGESYKGLALPRKAETQLLEDKDKEVVPCGTSCVVVKSVSHLGEREDQHIPGTVLWSCNSFPI